MSAAEKLKALQAKSIHEWQDGMWETSLVLEEVLPQIVALVEAAEKIRGDVPWSTGAEVHNALTALDEALT